MIFVPPQMSSNEKNITVHANILNSNLENRANFRDTTTCFFFLNGKKCFMVNKQPQQQMLTGAPRHQ